METKLNPRLKRALLYYFAAKQHVIASGYRNEIIWQEATDINSISTQTFYSEYAWVVLSSGMRESVVRRKFYQLSEVFEYWKDPSSISYAPLQYQESALLLFNHPLKINAIIWMAHRLASKSIEEEIATLKRIGIEYLRAYPFLGPATVFHFAKNIGYSLAKPDRHLIRISNLLGYNSPHTLCTSIAKTIGEKESVVDLIFWRYATLNKNYLTANC